MGRGRGLDSVHHWARREREGYEEGVVSESLERGADLDKPRVERVPGGRVIIAQKVPEYPLPKAHFFTQSQFLSHSHVSINNFTTKCKQEAVVEGGKLGVEKK